MSYLSPAEYVRVLLTDDFSRCLTHYRSTATKSCKLDRFLTFGQGEVGGMGHSLLYPRV